eukprot:CAMPEP_0201676948 /NCGR_PEP_ID=MMETSP0494-20130426/43022_1 /ASSEMBLY_ACC=CAM_ASM_000839 /TAXON_ID=420259 /ORGANISM="Thalassiosira gravida, Strain GMp14c1" /LENGTH=34 /DNA_ID= /DNA_START= /DNA_END= /DNA_ORIENTATION=
MTSVPSTKVIITWAGGRWLYSPAAAAEQPKSAPS